MYYLNVMHEIVKDLGRIWILALDG